uniref:Alpha-endosulfine n=1 Tax=Macaca fascicularis TaxID=9541 RepID=A0A7N9CTP0_MACFA
SDRSRSSSAGYPRFPSPFPSPVAFPGPLHSTVPVPPCPRNKKKRTLRRRPARRSRKSLKGSRDHKKQKEIDYSSESPCTTRDTQEKEGILPERAEEAKLKAKYPSLGQKPGGSDFLMKRLQKGQKYFDSGDYNMAKAKMKNKQLPSAGPDKNLVTGDHIPTPQDLPQRKSSLVTSKLAG